MEEKETIGYYQSFESFALVDGPGVRSVLFLQGCPFRCLFCHNPDTWEFLKKNPITPREAYKRLARFKPYWRNHGGITVSGGEPLAQIDFLIELAKIAHKDGTTVTLDTAGGPFTMKEPYFSKFRELLEYTDLIMLDIKCIDPAIHKKLTGHDNKNVLEMFRYLDSIGFPIWIRHVLVPGITDDDDLLKRTDAFIKTLHNVKRVEVLPYHNLGEHKYALLNIPYPLKGTNPPSEERIKNANALLHTASYQGYLSE